MVGYSLIDCTFGTLHPLTGLIHFQRRAQAPERILAAKPSFEKAEYFGDGAVIL